MKEKQFVEILEQKDLPLTEEQIKKFDIYFQILIEWNKKMNLTAITEKEEVYLKHFYDSITPAFFTDFSKDLHLCDVGAGAGFPSIPLKICFPHLKVTIIDSLKKRIDFLKHLGEALNLQKVQFYHGRAEDFGQNKNFRESFDFVLARAVAKMSVLSEYCLPLTKVKGRFIAMKGAQAEEELEDAQRALQKLGGEVEQRQTLTLPIEESERTLITIKKIKQTPRQYPRKAGTPQRKPL